MFLQVQLHVLHEFSYMFYVRSVTCFYMSSVTCFYMSSVTRFT